MKQLFLRFIVVLVLACTGHLSNGVALAAIQGLNQKLEERDARIDALEDTVLELQRMVSGLKRQLEE